MKQSVFIDIHAIQTVPPSCVNRDDTGAPKTAIYGGVERARVSSQAWKHAMRAYFQSIFAEDRLGSRTKQIPSMIAKAVQKIDAGYTYEEALKWAIEALKKIGIKTDDKKNENAALFFISKNQVKKLAELIVAKESDKEIYKRAMKDTPSLDIALFGRMVADDPSLNYDASAQVAHAISTHGVQAEYDYFTAVDDEQAENESGAGHLGTVTFNSATLYRYATINVAELEKNIGDETAEVVRGFVEAFVRAMPTGKQNTFANRTLPDLLYVTIRRDQPVNLAGAFECSVKNSREGYAKESCRAMLSYAKKVYSSFADEPETELACGDREIIDENIETMPLKDLLSKVEELTSTIYKETL